MRSERFLAVAERLLKIVLHGSPELMAECPFCQGAASLQFNTEKGLWLCFKCDKRGSAESLAKQLGRSYQSPEFLLEDLEDALVSLETPRTDSSPKVMPERMLARYGGRPHEYWTEKRRYTEDTIRRFQLGYDPLSDRLTIPYRNPDGGLLGVIQRRLDNEFPRYLYPRGFDRKGSLFGSWLCDERKDAKSAVLVEGSTDAIGIHQCGYPGLAQFGSSLNPRQVRLLHRLDITDVTLFYDYDAAGLKAFYQAPTVLEGFSIRRVLYNSDRYCWHEYLCNCPEDHKPLNMGNCQRKVKCPCRRKHHPDPGSLREKEIRHMLENSVPVGKEEPWSPWTVRRSRSGRSATAAIVRTRSSLVSRT